MATGKPAESAHGEDASEWTVGQSWNGSTLVYVGEHDPDNWAGWPEGIVLRFQELSAVADRLNVTLRVPGRRRGVGTWQGFCEAIGVKVASDWIDRVGGSRPLDRHCLDVALALLLGRPAPHRAGPLVVWKEV